MDAHGQVFSVGNEESDAEILDAIFELETAKEIFGCLEKFSGFYFLKVKTAVMIGRFLETMVKRMERRW